MSSITAEEAKRIAQCRHQNFPIDDLDALNLLIKSRSIEGYSSLTLYGYDQASLENISTVYADLGFHTSLNGYAGKGSITISW